MCDGDCEKCQTCECIYDEKNDFRQNKQYSHNIRNNLDWTNQKFAAEEYTRTDYYSDF